MYLNDCFWPIFASHHGHKTAISRHSNVSTQPGAVQTVVWAHPHGCRRCDDSHLEWIPTVGHMTHDTDAASFALPAVILG